MDPRTTTPPSTDPPDSSSVASTPSPGDPVRTGPYTPAPDGDAAGPEATPRAGRCRLLGEVGRGGMGAVLRAFDPDLGRDLAVKVLREEFRGRPEFERRFLAEARLTGRLQHPGVVPVVEAGRLADGRPFFTMKLVQGRTLADLLKERPDPSHDLPRFLAVFEQVCQTVAFAHSKGVIHRDLKPSNVMVGEFGEVQVMDWGLAKALAEAGEAGGDAATPGGAAGEGTQAGAVLGTVAYMAPEQARGEVDRLDARADVFGLGAILCEILTGRPPFAGPNRAEAGNLGEAFARLDGCGAGPELVRLAKACLAPDRERRPADAAAVAAAATAYRRSVEERLRRAELARVEEHARVLRERQRRRWTMAVSAAGLVVLSLFAAGVWWVQRLRAAAEHQQAERRQGVEAALDKVTDLQGQSRWAEARAVLEEAKTRLGQAEEGDLRQRLEQAGKDLDLVTRLDLIRLRKATIVENKMDYAGANQAYADAFREAGLGALRGKSRRPWRLASATRGYGRR